MPLQLSSQANAAEPLQVLREAQIENAGVVRPQAQINGSRNVNDDDDIAHIASCLKTAELLVPPLNFAQVLLDCSPPPHCRCLLVCIAAAIQIIATSPF